jgi:hypothetical protein
MAAFVAEGARIPRRGEIGLESNQIEAFEKAGYVMSVRGTYLPLRVLLTSSCAGQPQSEDECRASTFTFMAEASDEG